LVFPNLSKFEKFWRTKIKNNLRFCFTSEILQIKYNPELPLLKFILTPGKYSTRQFSYNTDELWRLLRVLIKSMFSCSGMKWEYKSGD
jgi:hypothetical protein